MTSVMCNKRKIEAVRHRAFEKGFVASDIFYENVFTDDELFVGFKNTASRLIKTNTWKGDSILKWLSIQDRINESDLISSKVSFIESQIW